MSRSPVDDSLICKCRNGDAQAFNQLVEVFSSRCYSYFYRLTGKASVSEDLLSELFIRLIEKIHLFEGGSFEKWLFTIASNLFRDYLRKEYRQKKAFNYIITEQNEVCEPRQSNADVLDRLQIVLERLDPETRELIILRFYSQMSFKELAQSRGEPIGTTLSKVHRGLKKLRELMENENE